jgi:hypothetical protein
MQSEIGQPSRRGAVRDLPGGDFCWAISEPNPRNTRESLWQFTVSFESLPQVAAYFRESKAFDNYLRVKAKRAVDYLNQIRTRLGIELTIEEAMR